MKKYWLFPALGVVLAVAGCSPQAEETASQPAPPQTESTQTQSTQTEPAQTPPAQAQPVQLTAEQELAKFCRVCVLDDGEKIEEYFPSRLDTKYEGKTYKLCSDDCKKKFDADPKRYALKP